MRKVACRPCEPIRRTSLQRSNALYPTVLDDETSDQSEAFHRSFTMRAAHSGYRSTSSVIEPRPVSFSSFPQLFHASFPYDDEAVRYSAHASGHSLVPPPEDENDSSTRENTSLLEALENFEHAYSERLHQEEVYSERPHQQQAQSPQRPPYHQQAHDLQRPQQQQDEDALLALVLQQEEDQYEANLRGENERRDQERRELVMQLLDAPPPARPSRNENKLIHYQAPDTIEDIDQRDFTLVNDCPEDDVCAICFETLSLGTSVSLRVCEHIFHLDCIDDSLEHSRRCPNCRKDIRGEPRGTCPSGSMSVTRPVVKRVAELNGYHDRTIIQIEYYIPDGIQREYHDRPGQPYKGITKFAYLPDTLQGELLMNRLIYAFTHGLVFHMGRDSSDEKNMVAWASIPHKCSAGELEKDDQYMDMCSDVLNQLEVPKHV